MINFIDCVRRFAPALPLRGTSLREDGLHETTDAVLTQHHNQPISTVWASIRNSPGLHLNTRRNLSKVQGQLIPIPAFDELTFDSLDKKRLHAKAWSLLNNKYNWN
jgi:hypothetical protein